MWASSIKGHGTGQVLTDTGAFLKNVDLFDHMEFGVTAKDVHIMPLGVRLLIETTFLSLYDAGINYRGKNVGCFMSGVAHDIFSVSGHVRAVAFPRCPNMVLTSNRKTQTLPVPSLIYPQELPTACHTISTYAVLRFLLTLRVAQASMRHILQCRPFAMGSATLRWSGDPRLITGDIVHTLSDYDHLLLLRFD